MGARLRKLVLFAALAGVVGFLVLDKPATKVADVPGVKTEEAAPAPARSASATADALQLPGQRSLERSRGELFNAPPPKPKPKPPQVVEAPPPPPVAPPVPYRFAGKVRKGGEEEVLVAKGEFVFPVKVGDTLDGMYRIESIGNDRIEVVYLPLGSQDRIMVSSALEVQPAVPRVAAAPAAAAPVADGRPAQLRWEGPERVQAGANFTVALRVNTKETLRAAPMQLRFEPDVLEPVNVRPGKFFGDGSFSYRVNPSGSIFVGATSQPAAPAADAELVIVTFKPIKRGATAELSMSALSLQGVAGRTISYEQVSAFRAAIH